MSNDEMQSIAGVVTRVFTAKLNEEGAWMPGKLIVLTDDGEVDFIAWPMKDFDSQIVFEPMRMPPWFAALDLETIEGASVKAIAVPRVSAYSGKVEFIKVNSFKVVPTQATPREEAQDDTHSPTPPPVQHTFSLDERIAWNSAINNAVTVHSIRARDRSDESSSSDFIPNLTWVGEINAIALTLYPLIRRGPVEPAVEADEQEESPDLPSLGSV